MAKGLKWAFTTFGPAVSPLLFFGGQATDSFGIFSLNSEDIYEGSDSLDERFRAVSWGRVPRIDGFLTKVVRDESGQINELVVNKNIRRLANRQLGIALVGKKKANLRRARAGASVEIRPYSPVLMSLTPDGRLSHKALTNFEDRIHFVEFEGLANRENSKLAPSRYNGVVAFSFLPLSYVSREIGSFGTAGGASQIVV